MLIRFGSIVAQATGALGSLQFCAGRSAPCLKLRARRSAQQTPDQLAHQAAHGAAAKNWSTLTPAQKFAWALYTTKQVRLNRLGVPRRLTPFQMYVGQNTLRAQIGAPFRTSPPIYGMSGIGIPAYIGFAAGGPYTLTLYAPTTDTTGYYAIYGHRPTSTKHIGRIFRHLVYSAECDTWISVDLEPNWTDKMGAMEAGELFWVSIRYLGDKSLASSPLSLTGTVS